MYRCYNKAVKYARKKRVPDCEKRSRLLRRYVSIQMNEHVENILNRIRNEFKNKSYEEIQSLSWINRQPIKIGWRKYYPSIWSQYYGDTDYVLIVQLTKWYIPNIFGATDSIGFIIDKNGKTTDVDAYWLMHEIGHP